MSVNYITDEVRAVIGAESEPVEACPIRSIPACWPARPREVPAVTQFLGSLYHLATDGTRIKPWSCCGGNHQTFTGLLDLVQKHAIGPDEIELIEHIGPNAPCTGALLRDEVHRGVEGKLCLRYTIAEPSSTRGSTSTSRHSWPGSASPGDAVVDKFRQRRRRARPRARRPGDPPRPGSRGADRRDPSDGRRDDGAVA